MKDRLADRPISQSLLWATGLLLCLTVLPHWNNLAPLISLEFLAFVVLRALFWRQVENTPSRWILLPLVLLSLGLVVFQAGLYEGRQFGVALLVVMAGLKFLELKSRRDLFIAIFLGYFLLITLFLYHQSPLITLFVLLMSMAYTALLVAANRIESRLELRFIGWRALWLVVSGIPVMILLFVFFPRLDAPLWTIKLGGEMARTGISDNISMGSISELSLSDEIAFRVRFQSQPPPRDQWYWRGLVLWHTDGKHWRKDEHVYAVPLPKPVQGQWRYEVTMEASRQPWLFPLDLIVNADATLQLDVDGQLSAPESIDRRFSYTASSNTIEQFAQALSRREKILGLQLPARLSARVQKLANDWKRRSVNDRQLVQQALNYFNQENFIYTLLPPVLGDDPVDEFLFETRRGFCEHYATSFVTLMRAAGLPARVVVGYQGGEINPIGGHITVRQSDAHAWAEVWLQDEGWQRFDPTAAVAPERVERTIDTRAARRPGASVVFDLGKSANALVNLAKEWDWLRDNLELSWHYWVIGFNRSRQQSLWNKLGLESLDQMKAAWLGILGALGLGGLFFLLSLRQRHNSRDPVQKAYHHFQSKLRRCGLDIPANMGPEDLAKAAIQQWPQLGAEIQAIIGQYIALRYGRNPRPDIISAYRRRIRRFRCQRQR